MKPRAASVACGEILNNTVDYRREPFLDECGEDCFLVGVVLVYGGARNACHVRQQTYRSPRQAETGERVGATPFGIGCTDADSASPIFSDTGSRVSIVGMHVSGASPSATCGRPWRAT